MVLAEDVDLIDRIIPGFINKSALHKLIKILKEQDL
jgi:hypothetical protein